MGLAENLSDYDFELLVADLLGADLGRRFETFPRGPDGGIDLRSRTDEGLHIVQCKHYPNAGFARVERAAKAECKVLESMDPAPARYTFVTSRRLTANNKEKVVAALAGFVENEEDVLGADDLTSLLRAHPQVERNHVKLWLDRAAPLERIVNADVFARSEALIDAINEALPRYVQTSSFAAARELLLEHQVVIVAGPPGVGKTTLARLLLLDSALAGYVPYSVQSDVAEAWSLFNSAEPQVFFFDDFLGRTALFDAVQDDARDLASFIGRVRRSESTRLILATREYVLQQAEREVEDLKWRELEADKFALTIDRYSRFEKARIFYNHVYASPEVDEEARRSLLSDRGYLEVIDHKAYSPRLIEWMTGLGGHRLSDEERKDYAAYCVGVLNDPERLWEHAFDKGLDRSAQVALYVLVSLPLGVDLASLAEAFDAAAQSFGITRGARAIDGALKVLQDSFIHLEQGPADTTFVRLLNPSLDDFLRRRLLGTPDDLHKLLGSARYFEQADWIRRLTSNAALDTKEFADEMVAAINRTLRIESPDARRSPRYDAIDALSILHSRFESPARRLATVAGWAAEDADLRDALAPSLPALLEPESQEMSEAPVFLLSEGVNLLARLIKAGYPSDELAVAIRDRALAEGSDLDAYDVLSELRDLRPDVVPDKEWADLLGRVGEWVDDRLDDPASWFDDLDDFDRMTRVVEDMGLALDTEAVDRARDEMEEAMAEREAEALRDVAVDDRDYDDDFRDGYADDTRDIDALFGGLSD